MNYKRNKTHRKQQKPTKNQNKTKKKAENKQVNLLPNYIDLPSNYPSKKLILLKKKPKKEQKNKEKQIKIFF